MKINAAQVPLEFNVPAARPFYTRLAALGFLSIALTGLVAMGFGLLAGDMSGLAFELTVLIVGLLLAGALLRFGAWAQVLAALLSFLVLALLLPFSIFNLLHPESAADFIPLVLLVGGAAFGFIGSLVSLIQRRRHALRATATSAEALALRTILTATALVAIASLLLTATARTTVSAEAKASAIAVEQKNFLFSPNRIQARAGQTIRVVVKNNDSTLHTFTLNEVGVDVSIPPGSERLIEFKAPASGAFIWYCVPHLGSGMVGTLVVQ